MPVPDWCFDAWPEAGVPVGEFDTSCAALAAAAAKPATDARLCWIGTAHHHPSRMKLVALGTQQPKRFFCVDVVDKTAASSLEFKTLAEQVARFRYMLDIQGKGYSSRLKLLLHTGRPIFVAARPWNEHYFGKLAPWVHYVPVREDLKDLVDRLDWAERNPDKVAAIGAAGQEFARAHLTHAAALTALRSAIVTGSATAGAVAGDDEVELARGTWATDRVGYEATKMYYRWTFMPVSKDRRRPLALLASRGPTDWTGWDLYTFGVYTGASVKFWLEQLATLKMAHGPMWGFDSFEGLPAEAEGMALECNAWLPGAFSAADQFDASTFGEVKRKINDYLGPECAAKTRLIKGFFSDACTPTLAAELGMKPALIIDCDVDLYISAFHCMDWMFAMKLAIAGTIVYYDDVSVIKEEAGELKAHLELTEKYDISWRKLHDSCWEVVSVGRCPPWTGHGVGMGAH